MSSENSIFKLSPVLSCNDILLSAWCQNGRTQVLALYLKRGEILLILATESKPKFKRIPWYQDAYHKPAALTFSPSGSFLLVLSEACHLYAIPALHLLTPDFKSDIPLDTSDITLFPYPYADKRRTPISSRRSSAASNCSESSSLETVSKLKELCGKLTEKTGTALAWWQSLQEFQHVAIVGTETGDVIMVDLVTGSKIRETTVKKELTSLYVCMDNTLDFIFLLINCKCSKQYKLVLEQRPANWRNRGGMNCPTDDSDDDPPKNYRARLHGLKQLSVETLANIKMKFAETRAKAQLKPPDNLNVRAFTCAVPEPINPSLKDNMYNVQYSRGRYVLTAYHEHSQLLTIQLMALDVQPLFVHKLPCDTGEILLCDRIMYIASKDRETIYIVSSHLSESRIEGDSEFNPESILGTFSVASSEKFNDDDREKIIAIYKGYNSSPPVDVLEHCKVDGLQKFAEDSGEIESCFVVTNKRVLNLAMSEHVISSMLRLILDNRAFLQAERLCKIFGMDLAKVLELAGDIKLAQGIVPPAIALFTLATCGPLKITAKLSRLGHCSEALNYCQGLLATSTTGMRLTDHIHISNLILLSFVHQILKRGGSGLRRRFLTFLTENDYYDKVLALSVTAQSLLFFSVHTLITTRGLVVDGYNVLVKVINNLGRDDNLLQHLEMEDLWICLSEPYLQEAIAFRKEIFNTYAQFLSRHISDLPLKILEKLCRLLDPLSPCLRPFIRTLPSNEEDENNSSFPLGQLVQLYLVILLYKLDREKVTDVFDKQLMLPEEDFANEMRCSSPLDNDSFESTDEQIWAIRKGRKDNTVERIEQSRTRVLSCGFGHTALIRDGTVITWGLSIKGNLGNGPALARHSAPESLRWFESFKLQVSQVSCGRNHTVALTNNGIYAWGSSQYGQLGLNDVAESSYPRLVTALVSVRVISVVCGQYHTLALTNCGSVFGFGWNVHGQLGLGTVENVRVPTLISALREHVIIEIAGGHGHSMVLTETGNVYNFGSSAYGQLGNGMGSKSSNPLLVKGISGRVVQIASSYFHCLALTSSNSLFTWGLSPQTARRQAQAHKRARAMQNLPPELDNQVTEETPIIEPHLVPSLVDTRNVSGKIIQISCGCHHSALVTDNGTLYTWGQSIDGQLGNGSRNEVVLPTLINDGSFKVSSVSLGCDFSVAIEKSTGKVFAWGSNGSGQVGIPIKEIPSKAADGKLILMKSQKRFVQIPNSLANLVNTPEEVPNIPSSTFTYQLLNSASSAPAVMPPKFYTASNWHKTLQHFFTVIHPDILLCKCLELGNHQAASKLLFLQGQIRQSLVHQLKALQQTHKNRDKDKEGQKNAIESVMKEIATPDTEIQLFAVQGGMEEMCEEDGNALINGYGGKNKANLQESPDLALVEYTNTACEILLKYLLHAPDCSSDILETSIQFWSAQKLPFSSLETFFYEHMDRVYYPLGRLMYLSKRDLARYFSTAFQLDVTARLVAHVERNGGCGEFLSVLSRLLSLDSKTSLDDISAKLQHPSQKGIQITWPPYSGEALYIFSCGHTTPRIVLPSGHGRLKEAYEKLDKDGVVDMACPECVCNVLSAEVA